MSSPFDIMTPAKAGFLGLFAERTSDKKLRGERMTGAAEVRGEKNKGHANFRAGKPTDPANTLLLMSDLSKNAPRGSVGSWTFAAPVTREGGMWRPLAAWGKPNKDDFAPFAAKRLGPNDAIAVETTGHADHETVVLTGASLDIIAQHRGPELHSRSTDVHDIDPNGDVSEIIKGGLHAPLKVMGWPLAFCVGLPEPDPTGKKTATPGQTPPSRYFPLLNFTKSEKDNSGNGAASFSERETVLGYEVFGPLRPSDDDHLIGLVNIGGVTRKVSEGAIDIYRARFGSDGTLFSPLRFFNIPWKKGAQGPFIKQVIFSEDFGATHAGLCGPHRGMKDWYTFSDWTELPKCKPTRTYVNAAGTTTSVPTATPSRYYPDQPTVYTPDETQNPSHRDQPRPCILDGPPSDFPPQGPPPPGTTDPPPKKNPPTAPPTPPGVPPPESACGETVPPDDKKTGTKKDFGYTLAQALAMPVISHQVSLPEYLVAAVVTGPDDPNEKCPPQMTYPAAMRFDGSGGMTMLHPATGNGTKVFAPAEIEDYHCLTNYKELVPTKHSDLTVMMLSGKNLAGTVIDTTLGFGWRAPMSRHVASGVELGLDFGASITSPQLRITPRDENGDEYSPVPRILYGVEELAYLSDIAAGSGDVVAHGSDGGDFPAAGFLIVSDGNDKSVADTPVTVDQLTGDMDGVGDFHCTGKATIDGVIDPPGLALTPVAANPGGALDDTTLWASTAVDNPLMYGAASVLTTAYTVGIVNGGTGKTTAAAAIGALIPQSTYSSAQTLVAADVDVISTAGAALTTESSPATGQIHYIKNGSTSSYCNIIFGGSKNFDGANTTFPLLPGETMAIRYDGTQWNSLAGSLNRKSVRCLTNFAAVNVVNTAAETEIVGFTIPANLLGANGRLEFGWHGSYFNNSGATRNFQIKCKVGGTTFIDATQGVGATGTTWGTRYDFTIKNGGATNVNYMAGGGTGLVDFAALTTGVGATGLLGGASVRLGELQSNTDMAKDSTADLAVSFTITLATNSVNLWYKHWGGTVLLIPG